MKKNVPPMHDFYKSMPPPTSEDIADLERELMDPFGCNPDAPSSSPTPESQRSPSSTPRSARSFPPPNSIDQSTNHRAPSSSSPSPPFDLDSLPSSLLHQLLARKQQLSHGPVPPSHSDASHSDASRFDTSHSGTRISGTRISDNRIPNPSLSSFLHSNMPSSDSVSDSGSDSDSDSDYGSDALSADDPLHQMPPLMKLQMRLELERMAQKKRAARLRSLRAVLAQHARQDEEDKARGGDMWREKKRRHAWGGDVNGDLKEALRGREREREREREKNEKNEKEEDEEDEEVGFRGYKSRVPKADWNKIQDMMGVFRRLNDLDAPDAPGFHRTSYSPPTPTRLSHVGEDGSARMVSVVGKASTTREARASATVAMGDVAFRLLRKSQGWLAEEERSVEEGSERKSEKEKEERNKNETLNEAKSRRRGTDSDDKKMDKDKKGKGDVLNTARIAGINAAKITSTLIPLCHNIPLQAVDVWFTVNFSSKTVEVHSTVITHGQTGVEMEALTAASVAALTVYDMCKAADKGIRIKNIQLEYKSGGKSGVYQRDSSD
eukprot:CAMPEP_0175053482 /NCGR_PEP_ID=MMETSP0052_2-20121109/8949_1 /TAXON_ID=51329 ORGANISM="Polytomella parva, Strain SAG 63-3" /NCGR_SAMPLE_ID=MMETSP0052_2 /ASSEMBLY_ACC=CAM_ASM_000194 /LENGTH=550 /DNA_ID=CAMNT_0016318021 /DNA_START=225 /DNA_END=1877 /DNA_ORIENTATION=+